MTFLNQGCLNPVSVKIPRLPARSLREDAAVVGGNVLTLQRIVDVVLLAFQACAASRGCCNITPLVMKPLDTMKQLLRVRCWSYLETGVVEYHMTNTRLTDLRFWSAVISYLEPV